MGLCGWRGIGLAWLLGFTVAHAATLPETPPPADSRVAITGHVLPALAEATPARAHAKAALRNAAPLTLTVVLRRSDPAGFERYLDEVYDRRSPRFRRFLTALEIADSFGPSGDDFALVQSHFEQQGFAIIEGSANRMTLTVAAARATVERALKVTLDDYAIGERAFFANGSDPELPAAIAARVQAVVGLSDLPRPRPMFSFFKKQPCKEGGDNAGYGAQNLLQDALAACNKAVTACSAKQQLNAAENADVQKVCEKFKPKPPTQSQRATAKGLPSGAPAWKDASGAGQKVGLIQFDTFVPSDVADYLALFGMPDSVFANLSQVHVNGGAPLGPDQSEVLLDVNTVLMGAPDAKVVVYDAPFGGGGSFQALFNRAISDGMTIISNSWTYCEDQTTAADVQSIDAILATAAGAGISVFNASGDSGSTCLDGSPNTIGVPAGSPHATAVGGTSLKTGPTALYESESWWNGTGATPPTGQGGFGVSRFFARPAYQNGFTGSAMRSIPDIAFSADPASGVILCQASLGGCPTGFLFGGTSIAAPAIAAAAATLNQATGHNLGNLNRSLYPLAGTTAFHTAASMGSDFAHVGLGSPNLNALYLALTGQVAGAVSAVQSKVTVVSNLVAADGTSSTAVVVRLRDANGNAISGKTVTLAANPAGNVIVTPASTVTTVANGAAVFRLSSLTAESVTLTATDITDSIGLQAQPTLVFGVPPAAGASISASPTTVQNDGIAATTITVTLRDALNRPTPGKLVTLAQGGGRSVISGPTPSVTDAAGEIRFTATNQVPEGVTYTAVDVTDGELPVPGSAVVTFSGQANASCVTAPPTAAPGYTLSAFSTGYLAQNFTYSGINFGGCQGASNPAFDTAGNVYVSDSANGNLYKFKFGVNAGAVSSGDVLASLGLTLGQPVFGNDGSLYVVRAATGGGGLGNGNIMQIQPATGAVIRTIASALTCPGPLAVDPLSGDLFFTDICFGGGTDNASLFRIRHPNSATPVLSVYATLPGTPNGAVAIAPNGTLYVATSYTGAQLIVQVSGTNTASPATVTPVAGINTIFWVAIAQVQPNGAAKSLIVLSPTGLSLVDLTATPFAITPLTIGGIASGTIGPDGCLYTSGSDTIYKLAPSAGGCGFSVTNPAPALRLTPVATTAPQGTQQTLTAQFDNLAVPANTPVYFAIGDANLQTRLGRTDAQGRAVIAYPGTFTGTDTIQARATIGATTYRSNLARVTWTAGPHAPFLNIDLASGSGAVARTAVMTGTLFDASVVPTAPIAGASIQFTVGAQSCTAITNASGVATCALTPAAAGSFSVTATYAGNASLLPALASRQFIVLGAVASVAAQPIGLDFGYQNVNAISVARSTLLTNAGTLPFALSSIVIGGTHAGDFTLGSGANACVAGGSIAANGGSCALYLTFTPPAAGARGATLTATDAGAGNAVPIPLSGHGNVPWFSQPVITADGVDAAQSGAIGDNQTSVLETVVTGPGRVGFDWKVSSEAFVDRLNLLLDGALVAHRSGDKDWLGMQLPIPAGTHTVGWQYTKNASASVGSDAAWVDRITFTPIAQAWTLTVAHGGSGTGLALSAPVTIDCDFGPGASTVGCTASLPQSTYRLYPLLDPGYHLVGWTGCDSVQGQVCVTNLDRDRSVAAASAPGRSNLTQVQEAYVAYYGRPADLGGQVFWATRLDQVNGDLAALIQAFGNSPEAQVLFGGMSDHDTVVTLYRQILGRVPEAGGLAFWVNELATGNRTRQTIALDLLNGAQNQDRDTVTHRVLAANAFTGDIAREEALAGRVIYAGDAAAARLRQFLGGVTDHPLSLDEFLYDVPGFIEVMRTGP